jgi:RNA polymerase sigma-70 factor (ECF subfamily)
MILLGRGQDDAAARARSELLLRYHEVVYHYFVKKLRDPHKAGELYSNFALKLLESDKLIKNADPKVGRFRHYLMRTVHNMYVDSVRAGAKGNPQPLTVDPPQPETAGDEAFPPLWRQELLNQAWKALSDHDRQTGQIHYAVLRFQSDHPELRAPQIAEQLGPQLKREMTPEAVRQWLHRAREKFADLLLEEVERSLEKPSLDQLEEELIDLQLLSFCQKALAKRRKES